MAGFWPFSRDLKKVREGEGVGHAEWLGTKCVCRGDNRGGNGSRAHSALDVEHRCEVVTEVTTFVNRHELALRGTEKTWRSYNSS